MSPLVTIFLPLLFFAAVFFAGLFYYLRIRYPNYNLTLPTATNELNELAQLLDNSGPITAKLIVEQLASRKHKGREVADVLALRLQAFCKIEEYNKALHCAMQLVRQGNSGRLISEIKLIEYLAQIYSALGHNEKSYTEYLVLHQKMPLNVEYLYGAAVQVLELKQYGTAVSLFEKVLQKYPDHNPSLCKLGRIYFEKNIFSQALDYFNRAYAGNYDSNELRYYLALTLIQSNGKDIIAFSLLNRVARDPAWAKQTLPSLAQLAAKLQNHAKVVAAVAEYRERFGAESDDILLNELKMLQAAAHRQRHELDKACNLWAEIPPGSIFYKEARKYILSLKNFSKGGIFYDYISLQGKKFNSLCASVCDSMLKAREPRQNYALESHSLKIIASQTPKYFAAAPLASAGAAGAIVVQNFPEHWDPAVGKRSRYAPSFHIFLRLEQPFAEADLLYNLEKTGIHKDRERLVNIYIYAFHYVSPANFGHRDKYNIHVCKSADLRQYLQEFYDSNSVSSGAPKTEIIGAPSPLPVAPEGNIEIAGNSNDLTVSHATDLIAQLGDSRQSAGESATDETQKMAKLCEAG